MAIEAFVLEVEDHGGAEVRRQRFEQALARAIAGGNLALELIGQKTGAWTTDISRDYEVFAAANLATKRAAASAVGLVGLFGYLSTTLSGWGVGKLVDLYGWDAPFKGMLIVAGLGTGGTMSGCGRFFNALRDTTTDHFAATYRIGERPPG